MAGGIERTRRPRKSQRTPEHPPRGVEGGDVDRFSELLAGVMDLASVQQASRTDFVGMAFDEMRKAGIKPDGHKVGIIMRNGFGTREEVAEEVSGMTPEEFDRRYPDSMGNLVRWYITPPVE